MNDVQKYEVKNQATEETHDLTWKTLRCEGEKPRAPASNNLTISRVLGYTPMAAYKRISSPRNPKSGLYPGVNLEQLQQGATGIKKAHVRMRWARAKVVI